MRIRNHNLNEINSKENKESIEEKNFEIDVDNRKYSSRKNNYFSLNK